MFNLLLKHPILFVLGTCLLFFITAGMFFYNFNINNYQINYIAISLFIILLQKKYIDRFFIFLISIIFLVLNAYFSVSNQFLLIIQILQIIYTAFNDNKNVHHFTFYAIFISFLVHLFYIVHTDIDFRQHDLSGTLYYMKKIAENGINWKNFDPWYMYYFFHQPLHFILMEYFLRFSTLLWKSQTISIESLQYFSLFYVTITSVLIAKILYLLKFRGVTYKAIFILLIFNPTFILFTGYISDDVPVLFWSVFTTYFLIKWYYTNKLIYIILVALGLGLGTLTKLSILLLAPAISWVFLYKLTTEKNKELVLRGIALFVIIAVPVALLWIMRNHILFDMQFYNVPDTSPMGQNFKYLSLTDRIGDFSKLFSPFMNAPYDVDANMILAIIKTELFGEWNFSILNKSIYIPSFILYILSLSLKVCAFIGMVYIFMRKNIACKALWIFFAITYLCSWIYAIKYALDYPYICSSDYRLFILLLLPEALFIGKLFASNKPKQNILFSISIIYAILSVCIYIFSF
ncbi:MAG: phospholipid carrier-dependent glycosyltransferase [Alphaproteobacteria bacterium]|nr:phospholipid carrier-dependent glycosyltransferase [Alphaproteobacteria bacterium]